MHRRSRAPRVNAARRPRDVIASACLTLALSACAGRGRSPAGLTVDRGALRASIDSMIADSKFRTARWGILIVDPARGDTLYSHDAAKLFVPASNEKIITSS